MDERDICKIVDISMNQGMYPIIGEEDIMKPKAHGTSPVPVQTNLKWNCNRDTADKICNFNRHFAEYAGYPVILILLLMRVAIHTDGGI